jgi:hypothetical protein
MALRPVITAVEHKVARRVMQFVYKEWCSMFSDVPYMKMFG